MSSESFDPPSFSDCPLVLSSKIMSKVSAVACVELELLESVGEIPLLSGDVSHGASTELESTDCVGIGSI